MNITKDGDIAITKPWIGQPVECSNCGLKATLDASDEPTIRLFTESKGEGVAFKCPCCKKDTLRIYTADCKRPAKPEKK